MGMQPMLERPRLIGALQRSPQRVAIVGPAGCGKSTLIEQWARYDNAIAVVSVTEAGPDCDRLAAAVAGELALRTPSPPSTGAGAADASWADALATHVADRRVALVVDDADRMSPAQREWFDAVLRRWPQACRLVLCGQTRPPGISARMVADGRAAVLSAHELAFDADEVLQFARLHGIELERAAAEALTRRCGGWPIGISAALRRARGRAGDDAAAAVLDELLDGVPPATQRILEQLAVLAPVRVDTAAAATGARRVADLVDQAVRAGLPMVYLDREHQTVRFDALLADHLAGRLARYDARAATALHRRAAAEAEQAGHLADAFRWLHVQGDLGLKAEFVYRWAGRLAARGNGRLAASWLDTFTVEDARHNPLIALAIAEVHPQDRRDGDVEFWLRIADRPGWGPLPDGLADAAVAVEQLRIGYGTVRARPTLPPGGARTPMQISALLAHAWNQYAHGEATAAVGTLRDVAPATRGLFLLEALRLVVLALIHAERDELTDGRTVLDAARQAVASAGATEHPRTFHVDALAALYAARAGDTAQALRFAEVTCRKLAASPYQPPDRRLRTMILLCDVYLTCNVRHRARATFGEAQSLVAAAGSVPHIRTLVDAMAERLDAEAPEQSDLTGAELRVLGLLPTHLTVPRMATQLYVAPSTVRGHLKSIYVKLGVHDRATAVERAMSLGLLA